MNERRRKQQACQKGKKVNTDSPQNKVAQCNILTKEVFAFLADKCRGESKRAAKSRNSSKSKGTVIFKQSAAKGGTEVNTTEVVEAIGAWLLALPPFIGNPRNVQKHGACGASSPNLAMPRVQNKGVRGHLRVAPQERGAS